MGPGSSTTTTPARDSTGRGALLCSEGLYTFHTAEWRKARNAGAREGLAAKPKPGRSAERVGLEKLRRKTKRLEAELERAKTALEIARNLQPLLEQLSGGADSDPKSKP